MTQRREKSSGTVRRVRHRQTGEIVGWQALLPEEFSKKPDKSSDKRYREPLGPMQPTEEAARRLLDIAVRQKRDKSTLQHGLPLAEYVTEVIGLRHDAVLRSGRSEVHANRAVSTWRSIVRTWLNDAPFYYWPPTRIEQADLQHWFDSHVAKAKSENGRPLSGSFIRNIGALLRAGFDRAKIANNPVVGLDLPEKNKPKVPHMDLDQQRALFGCREIDLSDRCMMGCGMGAGLRVNELLALHRSHVKLDGAAPHLNVKFGGRDGAPTKGRKMRRVELFEPGLGFWRMWMRDFATPGQLVFKGPNGGYLNHWPELFQSFGELAGFDAFTSHYMRHSYAVSMLSGSWGYDPQTLEFVQAQLGHSDIQTTERYYGSYVVGTWALVTQRMTGALGAESTKRTIITAESLLRDLGGSNGARSQE